MTDVNMKPDYGSQYHGVFAFISNPYIRHYYAKEVSEVSVLKDMEPMAIDAIVSNEVARVRSLRLDALSIALLFIIYSIAAPNLNAIAVNIGGILLVGIEMLVLVTTDRRRRQENTADQFFFLVSRIARNEACWKHSEFRWKIAANVERIARNVERIPLSISGVAPSVRRECLKVSRAKASALRELELLVIIPGQSDYAYFLKQLIDGLLIMSEGRWYDLPEAQYERQVSRYVRALQIGVACLALAGAIALLTLISKLGPAASVSATALIAISVAFANFAGVPVGMIEKYTQIGSDVVAIKK
jgi:hypothetical protein